MKVPPELDAITDRVLAFRPSRKTTPLEHQHLSWSVSVGSIFASNDLRLDAFHFNPELDSCLSELEALGVPLIPLSELATISLPGRFERIWAADSDHGLPYLNATDLMSLFTIGLPTQERYLSHESNVDMESLVIRSNWLLMTCSGTIGRVFHVPKRLDGWAATHDLIRIVPKAGVAGYLFAWCTTQAARMQVLSHTHGGQIDHVTDEQVGKMLVPVLPPDKAKNLDKAVLRALNIRERGLEDLKKLWPEAMA